MAVSVDELNRSTSVNVTTALEGEGITVKKLAQLLRKELKAKTSKTIKFKGKVERYADDAGKKAGKPILAVGVHVLAQGEKREYAKSGEDTVPYDDGDTVITWGEVAWDIRQKARMDAQKLLALYPVETKKITFDEETLNAILRGLPAGIGEAVRAELSRIISEKRY
jgi:hypothetical protein